MLGEGAARLQLRLRRWWIGGLLPADRARLLAGDDHAARVRRRRCPRVSVFHVATMMSMTVRCHGGVEDGGEELLRKDGGAPEPPRGFPATGLRSPS